MKKTNHNVEKMINELEQLLIEEQYAVESKISPSAPQSYCDDMKGCARGIFIAKNIAINFLRNKLQDFA